METFTGKQLRWNSDKYVVGNTQKAFCRFH